LPIPTPGPIEISTKDCSTKSNTFIILYTDVFLLPRDTQAVCVGVSLVQVYRQNVGVQTGQPSCRQQLTIELVDKPVVYSVNALRSVAFVM